MKKQTAIDFGRDELGRAVLCIPKGNRFQYDICGNRCFVIPDSHLKELAKTLHQTRVKKGPWL